MGHERYCLAYIETATSAHGDYPIVSPGPKGRDPGGDVSPDWVGLQVRKDCCREAGRPGNVQGLAHDGQASKPRISNQQWTLYAKLFAGFR